MLWLDKKYNECVMAFLVASDADLDGDGRLLCGQWVLDLWRGCLKHTDEVCATGIDFGHDTEPNREFWEQCIIQKRARNR